LIGLPSAPRRAFQADAARSLRRGRLDLRISGKDYPKIQILSIRQLLEEHAKPMLPLLLMPTYQQADRIPDKQAEEQRELFG
jgi:hypothetical protein